MIAVRKVYLSSNPPTTTFVYGTVPDQETLLRFQQAYPGFTLSIDPAEPRTIMATEHDDATLPDLDVLMGAETLRLMENDTVGGYTIVVISPDGHDTLHLNTAQTQALLEGRYDYLGYDRSYRTSFMRSRIMFLRHLYMGDLPATCMDVYVTLTWLGIPHRRIRDVCLPWGISYTYDSHEVVIYRGAFRKPIRIPIPKGTRREVHEFLVEAIFTDGHFPKGLPVSKPRTYIPGIGITPLVVNGENRIYVDGLYLCDNSNNNLVFLWEQYDALLHRQRALLETTPQEQ